MSYLAGVCLGMAGVDRETDAEAVKEAVHSWLQNEEVGICELLRYAGHFHYQAHHSSQSGAWHGKLEGVVMVRV